MERYLHLLSRGDKIGLTLIRLSIAIVFYVDWVIKVCPLRGQTALHHSSQTVH